MSLPEPGKIPIKARLYGPKVVLLDPILYEAFTYGTVRDDWFQWLWIYHFL